MCWLHFCILLHVWSWFWGRAWPRDTEKSRFITTRVWRQTHQSREPTSRVFYERWRGGGGHEVERVYLSGVSPGYRTESSRAKGGVAFLWVDCIRGPSQGRDVLNVQFDMSICILSATESTCAYAHTYRYTLRDLTSLIRHHTDFGLSFLIMFACTM